MSIYLAYAETRETPAEYERGNPAHCLFCYEEYDHDDEGDSFVEIDSDQLDSIMPRVDAKYHALTAEDKKRKRFRDYIVCNECVGRLTESEDEDGE